MKWVMCVLLLACKGHDEPPPPPHSDLLILSPGVPPFELVTYTLAKGTKAKVVLDVGSTIAAGEIQSASPDLHVALELAIDDVLPDGKMKLTSTIGTTTASGEGLGSEHVQAEGAQLAGLAITATLAPDGTLTDLHTPDTKTLPPVAQAELAQLVAGVQQLAMPLPIVPVGIGAKWRSSHELAPTNGLKLSTVTTIDLVGRTGATLTFAMFSEVHGADQTATQEGISVEVKHITGTSNGKGTLDLAHLAFDLTSAAELHMEMTTGSDRTPMTMTQTLRVSH